MITGLTQAELQRAANQALNAVPPGHSNAVVGTVDDTGVQVVALFKLGAGDRWTVSAAAKHAWSGADTVGTSLVYSW